ncbi:MAG: TDP-N-acetylfucosamine:lipid II N-acetylfucosaminyltransferase [Verrucomicrobiae bacterium]|nr:TDP-N-acetylfucosamine:lipid II N-acetylfucosaminyltransferase [Verrucomicrobiae bacterium]
MSIVHICNDEKFIDTAMELFDAAHDSGDYLVVLGIENADQLVNIRRARVGECLLLVRGEEKEFWGRFKEYQGVVFHSLNSDFIELAREAPQGLRLAWLSFGFDLHEAYPPLAISLLARHTAGIKRSMSLATRMRAYWTPLTAILCQLGVRRTARTRDYLSAVSRMDCCATVLPNEWNEIRSLPGFRAVLLRFNYGWVESLVPNPEKNNSQQGGNILVGNSNAMTCNHVDAFYKISSMLQPTTKVIVPLSYGGERVYSDRYQEIIMRKGRKILGDAFMPLTEFVPKERYMEIMSSCGTVVMNHHRQQALGNIIAAVYLGANVFINPRNPALEFLLGIGVKVQPFGSDFADRASQLQGVDNATLEQNRGCLRQEYSWEKGVGRAAGIVEFLEQGTENS